MGRGDGLGGGEVREGVMFVFEIVKERDEGGVR